MSWWNERPGVVFSRTRIVALNGVVRTVVAVLG